MWRACVIFERNSLCGESPVGSVVRPVWSESDRWLFSRPRQSLKFSKYNRTIRCGFQSTYYSNVLNACVRVSVFVLCVSVSECKKSLQKKLVLFFRVSRFPTFEQTLRMNVNSFDTTSSISIEIIIRETGRHLGTEIWIEIHFIGFGCCGCVCLSMCHVDKSNSPISASQ